ncbi:MAG: hypothetical protein M3394_09320 [Actinomycetota bacterium]|nr:hypothetical protein [Actinomycetota bacterium]
MKHAGKATLALSTALLAGLPGGPVRALPAGGGAVVGSVAYDEGQGLPAWGGRCEATSFALDLDVPAFVLDDGAGNRFAGPVSLLPV